MFLNGKMMKLRQKIIVMSTRTKGPITVNLKLFWSENIISFAHF